MSELWDIMRALVPEVTTPTTSEKLLYIEPRLPPSPQPLIDELPLQMTMAFRTHPRTGVHYFGHHECSCGACSSSTDYQLKNGLWTNSLCVHYLAYHRAEVPMVELAKVYTLPKLYRQPCQKELKGA